MPATKGIWQMSGVHFRIITGFVRCASYFTYCLPFADPLLCSYTCPVKRATRVWKLRRQRDWTDCDCVTVSAALLPAPPNLWVTCARYSQLHSQTLRIAAGIVGSYTYSSLPYNILVRLVCDFFELINVKFCFESQLFIDWFCFIF